MTKDLHVVLGSTGGAGNAIARALHEAGLAVRAVNRSGRADLPEAVELAAADITDPSGAGKAVAGATVVYMAAQPAYHRWPQEFPAMLTQVVDATAAAGAKLVIGDNLYGFGPGPMPLTQATPQRATDRKGMVRRQLAEQLLAAHRSGRVRVAIGRASDYFGPRCENSGITALAIEPAVAGKTIRWTGAMDVPHSVAFLPDIARAYVRLGTSDAADGAMWLLPHGAPVTGREFLDAVNAALPQPVRIGLISRFMLRAASPFHTISRESLGILYQWTSPFLVDDSAYQRTFGPFAVTPLEQALAITLEWYRKHP